MNFRYNLLPLLLAFGFALAINRTEAVESAVPSPETVAIEPTKHITKEEEISVTRQIAGYAVLAFLLAWMFVRSGRNKAGRESIQGKAAEEEPVQDLDQPGNDLLGR